MARYDGLRVLNADEECATWPPCAMRIIRKMLIKQIIRQTFGDECPRSIPLYQWQNVGGEILRVEETKFTLSEEISDRHPDFSIAFQNDR